MVGYRHWRCQQKGFGGLGDERVGHLLLKTMLLKSNFLIQSVNRDRAKNFLKNTARLFELAEMNRP